MSTRQTLIRRLGQATRCEICQREGLAYVWVYYEGRVTRPESYQQMCRECATS